MPGLLADSGLTWADVLRTWNELDIPEGWRPEITPGGIVMTPPPSGSHNLAADVLHRALGTVVGEEFGIFQSQGVGSASIGGIFIPDLCVAERIHIPRGSEPIAGELVVLAVEITSRSIAHHDHKRKKWAYAHGEIAQYLLIDAFDEDGPTISVFSEPEGGVYRRTVRSPFGKPVMLGDPVAIEIDSSLLPD